jgi:hypothetical protein
MFCCIVYEHMHTIDHGWVNSLLFQCTVSTKHYCINKALLVFIIECSTNSDIITKETPNN